jgi:hypothetical protein
MPSSRLEVAVHTSYEEYPTLQMDHCGEKPCELDIDDKVEGCETASEEAAA